MSNEKEEKPKRLVVNCPTCGTVVTPRRGFFSCSGFISGIIKCSQKFHCKNPEDGAEVKVIN